MSDFLDLRCFPVRAFAWYDEPKSVHMMRLEWPAVSATVCMSIPRADLVDSTLSPQHEALQRIEHELWKAWAVFWDDALGGA
jgi:hypothetical protein